MLVDDLLLEKEIGKGHYSIVYLTYKKNCNNKYITKKYNRNSIENIREYEKLIINEIVTLRNLNHPNIIKNIEIKKTANSFYVIYEYCNGGNLSEILEKYQQKFNNPFSLKIIQHLMRQIVGAFSYMYKEGIIHRNINLNTILINFDTEQDKQNLNMMKATVKIGGFKYAIRNTKKILTQNINHTNGFLTKCPSHKKDIYDLGKVCYKMVFGKYAYNEYPDDWEILINEIEKGKVIFPIILSKDILSFLKCMLINDPTKRLKLDQLSKHQFLINH